MNHQQPDLHAVPIPTGAIIVAVESLRMAARALDGMDPLSFTAHNLCTALRGISAGLETLAAWVGEKGEPLAEIYDVFARFQANTEGDEPEEESPEPEPPEPELESGE